MPGFKESEVEQIIVAVKTWARRSPINSFAIVGSWARKQARSDSDLDLMFLTSNPELFLGNTTWFNNISWNNLDLKIERYYDRTYGVVRSRHLVFQSGQRIEFSFGNLDWAKIDPIDSGTYQVVSNGMRIISDRHRLLGNLQAMPSANYVIANNLKN